MKRALYAAILIACMVGVAPAKADARPSQRMRIHKLEKRLQHLQRELATLEQQITTNDDYAVGMFNCIGYSIGVDATPIQDAPFFGSSPLVWSTTMTPNVWVVTVDPSCLDLPAAASARARVRIAR